MRGLYLSVLAMFVGCNGSVATTNASARNDAGSGSGLDGSDAFIYVQTDATDADHRVVSPTDGPIYVTIDSAGHDSGPDAQDAARHQDAGCSVTCESECAANPICLMICGC